MTPFEERLLIPVKEASAWLGIPAFTLYSWALSRRIPHYKIGKRVMFSKDDLKRWIDSQHRKEAS
jgi:excisionase family DNA binding protein